MGSVRLYRPALTGQRAFTILNPLQAENLKERSNNMLVNILLWILFGALAGWIAGKLMNSETGLVTNIILGVIGALVGGFLAGLIGIQTATFSILGLVIAVAGACLVIFVFRKLKT
jgi:uncharacterized membrane protein YeaQ/YmgE (transglycosylase-associated protein family)